MKKWFLYFGVASSFFSVAPQVSISADAVIDCFKSSEKIVGPLFSDFTTKHWKSMISIIKYDYSGEKNEIMAQLMKKLTQFTKEQYKKKSIVLFHGQHSQWAFLERCCNELTYIKFGIVIPDSFVRMRFQETPPVNDTEAKNIRAQGIQWNSCWSATAPAPSKVLFVNLHPLANADSGSNSFCYVRDNFDCSAHSYDQEEIALGFLEKMFKDFGYSVEHAELGKKDKKVFKKLFKLYEKLVQESGKVGRFIAFSLPRPVAKRLAYPTYWHGNVLTKYINGKATDNIVEISDYFDQIPFDSEYCLILSKEICNPAEAKKAGVVIKAFDAFDRASEAYKNFDRELNRIMKQVAEQYSKRVPGSAERVKKYATALLGVAFKKQKAAAVA